MILPFASIGEAVIPKILGRSDGFDRRYESRIMLQKGQSDFLHTSRASGIVLTVHKDGLSLCDGLHQISRGLSALS